MHDRNLLCLLGAMHSGVHQRSSGLLGFLESSSHFSFIYFSYLSFSFYHFGVILLHRLSYPPFLPCYCHCPLSLSRLSIPTKVTPFLFVESSSFSLTSSSLPLVAGVFFSFSKIFSVPYLM